MGERRGREGSRESRGGRQGLLIKRLSNNLSVRRNPSTPPLTLLYYFTLPLLFILIHIAHLGAVEHNRNAFDFTHFLPGFILAFWNRSIGSKPKRTSVASFPPVSLVIKHFIDLSFSYAGASQQHKNTFKLNLRHQGAFGFTPAR